MPPLPPDTSIAGGVLDGSASRCVVTAINTLFSGLFRPAGEQSTSYDILSEPDFEEARRKCSERCVLAGATCRFFQVRPRTCPSHVLL